MVDQGLCLYKIFYTDALNIFLIKTTNVTKNKIINFFLMGGYEK